VEVFKPATMYGDQKIHPMVSSSAHDTQQITPSRYKLETALPYLFSMLTVYLLCTQYEHWTQILGHQPNKRRQQ
jgi:hypothetical protein